MGDGGERGEQWLCGDFGGEYYQLCVFGGERWDVEHSVGDDGGDQIQALTAQVDDVWNFVTDGEYAEQCSGATAFDFWK